MKEVRITDAGMVFEAAPDNTPQRRVLGPQKIKGSKPRNWETRRPGECAAIVEQVRDGPGWALHYACCLPVEDGLGYCTDHNPYMPSKFTARDLMRSVRKIT